MTGHQVNTDIEAAQEPCRGRSEQAQQQEDNNKAPMPPADARGKETSDSVDNELDFSMPSASTDESLNGQKGDEKI